jgi:hypothetical protein
MRLDPPGSQDLGTWWIVHSPRSCENRLKGELNNGGLFGVEVFERGGGWFVETRNFRALILVVEPDIA